MLVILNCNNCLIKDIVKEIFKVLNFVSLLIVKSDFSFIRKIYLYLSCLSYFYYCVKLLCSCTIFTSFFLNMSGKILHYVSFWLAVCILTLSFLATSHPEYPTVLCATSQWLLTVILWCTKYALFFLLICNFQLVTGILTPIWMTMHFI